MEGDPRPWIDRYFGTLNTQPKTREVLDAFIRDDHLVENIQVFERAFPRYQLRSEDVPLDGNRVAVRSTLLGTHLGELYGMAPNTDRVPDVIVYLRDDHTAGHVMPVAMPRRCSVSAVPRRSCRRSGQTRQTDRKCDILRSPRYSLSVCRREPCVNLRWPCNVPQPTFTLRPSEPRRHRPPCPGVEGRSAASGRHSRPTQ